MCLRKPIHLPNLSGQLVRPMKYPNHTRCIILFALVLCLTVTPCHALTLFKSDYDADTWIAERLDYGDWLPLRELSSILSYTVEWEDRTIYVYAKRTWTIKPDRWMPDATLLDGMATLIKSIEAGVYGWKIT